MENHFEDDGGEHDYSYVPFFALSGLWGIQK